LFSDRGAGRARRHWQREGESAEHALAVSGHQADASATTALAGPERAVESDDQDRSPDSDAGGGARHDEPGHPGQGERADAGQRAGRGGLRGNERYREEPEHAARSGEEGALGVTERAPEDLPADEVKAIARQVLGDLVRP
jgi:hypothetical protein